jgi:uncharacterized membrane protein YdfJ with MMPL/SSD domain
VLDRRPKSELTDGTAQLRADAGRISGHGQGDRVMNILVIIIAIVAVILLFTGGFVHTLNFLLWVGIALLVIAAIVFLLRYITGNRRA